MLQTNIQYSKLRWLLTILGLVLYVLDIWNDIGLALNYFYEAKYVWSGMTVMFVFTGLLVSQIFSYVWYLDDMDEGEQTIAGMSKGGLAALHVICMGIFIRYYHLLKRGFKEVWKTTSSCTAEQMRHEHHKLFCMATDLSLLKLLEAFLESAPQLLLQLYIILSDKELSVMQCLSLAFSFFSVAWALVDYRRCLRRSLIHIREMPSGLPTTVYLLYKLCTITSHILSYSLLLILSPYITVALTILWLLGTTWAHLLQTNFCSSRGLELLYRAVVGVILVFTFFNVKGQDTKVAMIIYYVFYSIINFMTPLLLALLMPELQTSTFLLPAGGLIFGGSVLGLLCLVLYYLFLHPEGKRQEADEVDGLGVEAETTRTRKVMNFLQP
ncbi:XK-related protein 9 [Odontesthes bonariensis]|uniref:XK-related protein 9 n=1 Tax=Odontesthes bonariensis TaxID=219752 RepID=UPI003F588AEF